jgi:hypothetical protein
MTLMLGTVFICMPGSLGFICHDRYIPLRLSLFGESELIGLSVDESHICNAELYANAKQESGQQALMEVWHQYIAMKEMTIKEQMHQQLTMAGGATWRYS